MATPATPTTPPTATTPSAPTTLTARATRLTTALFRASLLLFLLGGFVIVALQAVGIALGDAAWVADTEERLGPATFATASVAGLLAFALTYLRRGTGSPSPGDGR